MTTPRPNAILSGTHTVPVASDEIVVFLIGMRINRLRSIRSWWPVAVAMPRMLRELGPRPDLGLLSARTFLSGRTVQTVQYWNSAEQLGAYARDPSLAHQPAWEAFFRSEAATNGAVGIYHETYVVPASGVENMYRNMPAFGLGAALTPQRGRLRGNQATAALGQPDSHPTPENQPLDGSAG